RPCSGSSASSSEANRPQLRTPANPRTDSIRPPALVKSATAEYLQPRRGIVRLSISWHWNRINFRPFQLPAEIPDRWLAKMKETLPQSKWWTILTAIGGSSLLAAILTTCGNYWIESHKARLNYQVELAKARLQNQEIELTARRTAYDALDRELAD